MSKIERVMLKVSATIVAAITLIVIGAVIAVKAMQAGVTFYTPRIERDRHDMRVVSETNFEPDAPVEVELQPRLNAKATK